MTDPAEGVALRVLSWNVRSLRDDTSALVSVVRALAPDVLAVQEAPRSFRWRSRLAALARRTGLLYTCGGRTVGGPALLTSLRMDVRELREWRLPRTPGQYQRGVAGALLRVGGVDAFVGSVHLGLTAREREAHAHELGHLLAGLPLPILAGDLNETSTGAAWSALTGGALTDAYVRVPAGGERTYPAVAPAKRIDAVLVGAEIGVRACGVPLVREDLLARATDHRPVLADLVLPIRS